MAKSFCDASKQPDIESPQDCELEACLSRYYWKAEYGYCMASCGEGQFKYFLFITRFFIRMTKCSLQRQSPVDVL